MQAVQSKGCSPSLQPSVKSLVNQYAALLDAGALCWKWKGVHHACSYINWPRWGVLQVHGAQITQGLGCHQSFRLLDWCKLQCCLLSLGAGAPVPRDHTRPSCMQHGEVNAGYRPAAAYEQAAVCSQTVFKRDTADKSMTINPKTHATWVSCPSSNTVATVAAA